MIIVQQSTPVIYFAPIYWLLKSMYRGCIKASLYSSENCISSFFGRKVRVCVMSMFSTVEAVGSLQQPSSKHAEWHEASVDWTKGVHVCLVLAAKL